MREQSKSNKQEHRQLKTWGAEKNDRKDILIYRKWQGAIKCLHKKRCLQSNRSSSNHFTKQKDLEAFTTGKRNPNDVRGGAHILGSNFTIP